MIFYKLLLPYVEQSLCWLGAIFPMARGDLVSSLGDLQVAWFAKAVRGNKPSSRTRPLARSLVRLLLACKYYALPFRPSGVNPTRVAVGSFAIMQALQVIRRPAREAKTVAGCGASYQTTVNQASITSARNLHIVRTTNTHANISS